MIWNWILVMAEQFCEYTKIITELDTTKTINFMVCEMYLNFLKKEEQQK